MERNTNSNNKIEQLSYKVHRKVWISDLLRMKKSSQTKDYEIFTFGNPCFDFASVRILGVIVGIQTFDSTMIYLIDDSSGLLNVHISKIEFENGIHLLKIGKLVDFIGRLHCSSTGNFLLCSGFDSKEDPLSEIVRCLEIVDLYRDFYFVNSFHPNTNKRSLDDMESRFTTRRINEELWKFITDNPGVDGDQIKSKYPKSTEEIDTLMAEYLVYEKNNKFFPL